jgi:FKBP-type peptidyl-prolyl cis-trans isomerase FkpA
MTKGIEIRDVEIGSGKEAQLGNTVVLNLRMFLHRGEEVFIFPEPKVRLDLKGRLWIAGLRDGIVGMRVGGKRTLIISPHLAYGAEGLPGKIPPNALLRCEIELLAVRELGEARPEDFPPERVPPGRHVVVYCPGEAARNLPRWQFGLGEDGNCGAGLYFPIPGMTWRHTRRKEFQASLEPAIVQAVLNDAVTLPMRFPNECLTTDDCWADMSEPANNVTRDRETNTRCLTIDVWERGQHNYYRLRENSPALNESELYKTMISLLRLYFSVDSVEASKPQMPPQLPD